MKSGFKNILVLLQAISALLIIGAVYIWAPVCDKLLKLENGKMVPMKCAHSAKLFVALAIIILAVALITFISKRTGAAIQLVVFIAGILLLLNTFSSFIGIGICTKIEMPCNVTALWVRICSIVAMISSLAYVIFEDKKSRIPN